MMQAMAGEEGPVLSRLYLRSLRDIQWLDPEQPPSGVGGVSHEGGQGCQGAAPSALGTRWP